MAIRDSLRKFTSRSSQSSSTSAQSDSSSSSLASSCTSPSALPSSLAHHQPQSHNNHSQTTFSSTAATLSSTPPAILLVSSSSPLPVLSPPKRKSNLLLSPFRLKTKHEKQLAREHKYKDWKPPHRLKYPGKRDQDTVEELEGWRWDQARSWRGNGCTHYDDDDYYSEALSPTATRWTDGGESVIETD